MPTGEYNEIYDEQSTVALWSDQSADAQKCPNREPARAWAVDMQCSGHAHPKGLHHHHACLKVEAFYVHQQRLFEQYLGSDLDVLRGELTSSRSTSRMCANMDDVWAYRDFCTQARPMIG